MDGQSEIYHEFLIDCPTCGNTCKTTNFYMSKSGSIRIQAHCETCNEAVVGLTTFEERLHECYRLDKGLAGLLTEGNSLIC